MKYKTPVLIAFLLIGATASAETLRCGGKIVDVGMTMEQVDTPALLVDLDPQGYRPKDQWMQQLAGVSEGSITTLGAYHRPWQ